MSRNLVFHGIACGHPGCTVAAQGTSPGVASAAARSRGLRRTTQGWRCADHAPARCPHGNGPADQRSQCLGAVPRRVDLADDGQITIDAELVDTVRARNERAQIRNEARVARGYQGRKNSKKGPPPT